MPYIVSLRYISYINVLVIEMKKSKKETSLNRKKSVVLIALLVAFTTFAGCLSDDEISCGEGTELVDGECISITDTEELNTITFTLVGKDMSFVGDGGDIDGITNPEISKKPKNEIILSKLNKYFIIINFYIVKEIKI